MSDVKDGLYYTKTHQWYDPGSGKVGITTYAAEQLGEISQRAALKKLGKKIGKEKIDYIG